MDLSRLTAYELIKKEDIPDVASTGYLLRHKKSGARVMLLENDDDNKVFDIAFRTTPHNSTGVAHIMEHTVLCGSRKFPSKDPFVELVKGSMNTFLNAMTYPDKTVFPVASTNDQDFKNLMDVYLDAVFYPNIYKKEEIFRQEGWHYEIEKEEDPITLNGVVYNEMKGAFSSPDDVVDREIMNGLFPDTTYGYESGGDPEVIPQLTYEEYLNFHRTYYHPCNSYIYLYGKMDFEERLTWLDEAYLSHFEPVEVHSEITLQKPFAERKVLEKYYPISQGDEEKENTYLTLNLVVGTSLDTRLANAMAVLEYVLLETPGAPLKQALLDAGLGKDIMGSYDSGTLQPIFSIIAKNAEPSMRGDFVRVISQTLEGIVKKGLDQKALLAAINLMEFRFREADYGNYPKGLIYGLDLFDSWLYDDDRPFDYLRQLDDYAYLKEHVATGYFEQLIQTCLLDNTHGTILVVKPQKGLTAQIEQRTAERLAAYKAGLSHEEIQDLIRKNQKLRAFQETPSTQEELEKIPMLTRTDLKREIAPFSNEIRYADGAWIIHHDYPTNGIGYLTILFDASVVAPEDLVYLSLLRHVLGMVDTEHYTYSELNNEIGMRTGGISAGLSQFRDSEDGSRLKLALGVQARTLYDQIGFCFDMTREILFTSRLDQEKRLLEILRRLVSRTETRLTEAGSATVSTRVLSYRSPLYRMNDCFGGIAFYDAMKDLEAHFDERKEDLIHRLQRILREILLQGRVLISFTGDGAQIPAIREGASALMAQVMKDAQVNGGDEAVTDSAREPDETQKVSGTEKADPSAEPGAAGTDAVMRVTSASEEARKAVLSVLRDYPELPCEKLNEGIRTSAKIQYVARGGNFREAGFEFTGALRVLRTIMSYEYLWSNIRVVGGAYGCSASFARSGETVFASYRDPQLRRTNEVYDGVPEYVAHFTVDERDMTKYVIGTVSDIDTPLTPSAKGARSLNALLCETDPSQVQRERDQVLDATQEDIRALAPLMAAALGQNDLCVLGNEDRINEAADLFMNRRDL